MTPGSTRSIGRRMSSVGETALTALLNTAHMDTPFEYDVPVS
jgi:hypothetical protein